MGECVTSRVVKLPSARYAIGVRHTYVTGGGDVRLHVVEAGNPTGRPILFIHGFSQSWLSWRPQLCSDLVTDYRLVAMDLRGHGESDKPPGAYSERGLWAQDLDAVMRELHLERPVLCGWSYGSLVILDYIRQYGEDAMGGICFVDALTRLGTEEALSVLTAELLNLVPGLVRNRRGRQRQQPPIVLATVLRRGASAEDLYLMLGYNVSVPPHVRQALFSAHA